MRRTRIKICGLTDPTDAAAAVRAGADALGVIFAGHGPRHLTLAAAERVFAEVPPLVARVGVFVDAPEPLVAQAVARLNLTAVQFHGTETPERCAASPVPVLKAFRVTDPAALAEEAAPYEGAVAALLLDTYVEGTSGGTGQPFAWERFRDAIPRFAPVIVAGGLDPVNVGAAIGALRPFAVDVSSGVEEMAGCKDAHRMEAFVAAVVAADVARRGAA